VSNIVVKKQIKRFFETGKVKELTDELINECRLSIRLDGEDFVRAMVSPSLLEEFVLGFLLTRGLIQRAEDVSSIEITDNLALVIRNEQAKTSLPSATLLESTGNRNVDLAQDFRVYKKIDGTGFRVPAKVIINCVRMLSKMPVFNRTGGTHCAILFSPAGESLFQAEDLGRHNTVDKVIGGGLKKGIDLSDCWLAVSGRLPSDMVFKAAMVGIPLIASVSAVTSDGVKTGERAGMTVVGFVRDKRLNCYCHPERVVV